MPLPLLVLLCEQLAVVGRSSCSSRIEGVEQETRAAERILWAWHPDDIISWLNSLSWLFGRWIRTALHLQREGVLAQRARPELVACEDLL